MNIKEHTDLKVYQLSFKAGMEVFELTRKFPKEEKYLKTTYGHRYLKNRIGVLPEGIPL